MELLTIQKPGIDITTNVEPANFYTDPKGSYYKLACHLGWEKPMLCVRDITTFSHDGMFISMKYCLWVLDVPEDHITWASLERYFEGNEPPAVIFHNKDYIVHELHETPMGLIQSPVKADWVVAKWLLEPYDKYEKPAIKTPGTAPVRRRRKTKRGVIK